MGVGVLAARDFVEGEQILRDDDGDFYDNVYNRAQLNAMGIDILQHALQIAHDQFVLPFSNIDDFTNHSCDPNCGVTLLDTGYRYTAIRDIYTHEQIMFDYSTYMFDDSESFDCECGSANCRRRIEAFSTLPEERKKYFISKNIVAPTLRDI